VTPPDWRTLLFVPVGAERHLASAIRHRPDAIILDLEDAVAPARKAEARSQLPTMQRQVRDAGIACVLRVNRPVRQMVRDLESAEVDLFAAIMVPKCDSAAVLASVDDIVSELTRDNSPGLVALIETPGSILNLKDISGAPGLVGMMLGSEDYCASLGVSPEDGALELPATAIAMACAGRGLLPIGMPGSLANYKDLDLYARNVARGRQLGFRAVAAIHPAQLPIIREKMLPTANEVAWARQIVLAAAQEPASAVLGSSLGMIDPPVLARARSILAAFDKKPR
jgi:citrate lyase subunit beta/citryl-CoA lyase